MADQFKEWVHYFFCFAGFNVFKYWSKYGYFSIKMLFSQARLVCLNMAGGVAELNTQTQNHPHMVDRIKRLN